MPTGTHSSSRSPLHSSFLRSSGCITSRSSSFRSRSRGERSRLSGSCPWRCGRPPARATGTPGRSPSVSWSGSAYSWQACGRRGRCRHFGVAAHLSLRRCLRPSRPGGPPKGWVAQAFRGLAKSARQETIGRVGRSHALACSGMEGREPLMGRGPRLRTAGHRRLQLADETGVALVEFVLVLPLLLVLLLGMIDVGKARNYWNDETHLANEAARYAAVNKNPGPQSTLNQSILNQADTTELKNGGTTSLPAGETICIWF